VNSGAQEGLAVPAPHVTLSCYYSTIRTSSDMEIVLNTSIRK
jgi:hypothetical protein